MPLQRSMDAPVAARESLRHSPSGLACLAPVVRIGAPGYRDLADPSRGGAEATAALSRLLAMLESAKLRTGIVRRAAYGPTALGYRRVSPLAEGADRVMASLVLSSDEGLACRVRELVVPLPFSLDYYRGQDGRPGAIAWMPGRRPSSTGCARLPSGHSHCTRWRRMTRPNKMPGTARPGVMSLGTATSCSVCGTAGTTPRRVAPPRW